MCTFSLIKSSHRISECSLGKSVAFFTSVFTNLYISVSHLQISVAMHSGNIMFTLSGPRTYRGSKIQHPAHLSVLWPVGTQAKDKTRIFPNYQVLRENSSAMFCCVPPRGVHITSMSFNHSKYPLMSIGAGVKAITVHNLKIPTVRFKYLLISCNGTTGRQSDVWNFISCKSEMFWCTFFKYFCNVLSRSLLHQYVSLHTL